MPKDRTGAASRRLIYRGCGMSGAVTHLFPCMQAMTVCAKQSQIASVCGPIAEPIVPYAGTPLVSQLLRRVDVVDVENAKVILPAFDASATQLGNQSKFAPPIGRMFVQAKAVLIPMVFSALLRAKTMFAVSAAALASRLSLPSGGKIASPRAILTCAVFEAIEVSFKRLFAVAAVDCNSALFHAVNISNRCAKVNFDIACKRIEDAQRQGDMFIEVAA